MLGAVVIAIALVGAGDPVPAPGVDLMREACVATEMRSDNLRAVANERGWEALLRVVRSEDDRRRIDTDPNWEGAYAAASGRVIVSGAKDQQPLISTCTVVVEAPDAGWRSSVEALAGELQMSAGEATTQDDVESRTWTAPDGRTLVSDFYAADGALELTLSR